MGRARPGRPGTGGPLQLEDAGESPPGGLAWRPPVPGTDSHGLPGTWLPNVRASESWPESQLRLCPSHGHESDPPRLAVAADAGAAGPMRRGPLRHGDSLRPCSGSATTRRRARAAGGFGRHESESSSSYSCSCQCGAGIIESLALPGMFKFPV